MVEDRAIEVTGRYLGKLEKAPEVVQWTLDNKERLEEHLAGYDELITRFNQVPSSSPLLEVLPKAKKLKGILGNTPLPTLNEMAEGNFAAGLIEARKPMLLGQRIKSGKVDKPTAEDRQYAIGTPSMETSDEALAVGTAGHLAERTFFQWARKQNLTPSEGWKKDDWLQVLDEVLILTEAEGKKPHLRDFFVRQNNEGGLGWLNEQKVAHLKNKIRPVLELA